MIIVNRRKTQPKATRARAGGAPAHRLPAVRSFVDADGRR